MIFKSTRHLYSAGPTLAVSRVWMNLTAGLAWCDAVKIQFGATLLTKFVGRMRCGKLNNLNYCNAMGMYTDLNARLLIKEEFWPVINMLRDPATDNGWDDVAAAFPQYPFLAEWASVGSCDAIPYSCSSQQWRTDDTTWNHTFKSGVWTFQCSLKNYEGEIEFFVATVLAHIVDQCLELYSRYEENEMPEQLFIPELEEDEDDTTLARSIATKAHEGQFRRDGVTPYIAHPRAVAMRLSLEGHDRATIEAGWLHDVLEDTEVTISELKRAGISERVIEAVVLLTRRDNQSYEDYLKGVASSPVARLVKLADIHHNMSDAPTDKQVVKYTKALAYLAPLPPPAVLWLSLPDAPELQDAHLLATLSKGDAWTADIHQAARIAGMGYAVKRCDRHVAGHLVETTIDAAALEISIERGIEMRGVQELNRPNK
jgi:hypothetical protein